MPEEERVERHANMCEYVSKFTIQHWADKFVTELQTQEQEHGPLEQCVPSVLRVALLLASCMRPLTGRRLTEHGTWQSCSRWPIPPHCR